MPGTATIFKPFPPFHQLVGLYPKKPQGDFSRVYDGFWDFFRCAGYVRRVTHDEIADAVG